MPHRQNSGLCWTATKLAQDQQFSAGLRILLFARGGNKSCSKRGARRVTVGQLTNGNKMLMLLKLTTELAFFLAEVLARGLLAEKQDNMDDGFTMTRPQLPHQLHIFAAPLTRRTRGMGCFAVQDE